MSDVDDHPPTIDALWHAHATELIRFATVLVGPSDAGDIVADTILRAEPSLSAGTVDSPRAYLFRSVANAANDLRRSRGRRWRRDLATVGPARVDAPDTFVDVRRAVSRLTVEQRAVVFLSYWEDMTERDIAVLLHLSAGTVHRRLVLARDQLRRALR